MVEDDDKDGYDQGEEGHEAGRHIVCEEEAVGQHSSFNMGKETLEISHWTINIVISFMILVYEWKFNDLTV